MEPRVNAGRRDGKGKKKSLVGASFLGLAVSIGCLLPPILHFVTGPLGPALGGFLAGSRCRCGPGGAAAVGALMGAGTAAFLAAAGVLIAGTGAFGVRVLPAAFAVWTAAVFLYVFLLAFTAAWMGGASVREREEALVNPLKLDNPSPSL